MTDFTVGSSVITSSEADENAGVFFDDYRKVRVLQPEAEHQALELKDECKEFLEKSEEFRQMVQEVLDLADRLSKAVEKEKMKAIACRNLLQSMVKDKQDKHEQVGALISEKTSYLERLRLQHASLLKVEAEQHEFIEQFLIHK